MGRLTPTDLRHPIVQAPMAGGPSNPALAAAVSTAGGLGFLAAGYQSVEAVQRELDQIRSLLNGPMLYGVNVFAPPGHGDGAAEVTAYAQLLRAEASRRGVALGVVRWDDDSYESKLDLLCAQQVPVVSTTFGCPSAADVRRLHEAGSAVWVTVTTVGEAELADRVGVDALIVQGAEAGGHRGGFDDTHPGDFGLLALLQLVSDAVGADVPLIATGGLSTGRAIAGVLAAGAAAAQLGRPSCCAPRPVPANPTAT